MHDAAERSGSCLFTDVPVNSEPPPRARLDPLETNRQVPEATPWGTFSSALESDVAFRHSGWQRNRRLVAAAFKRLGIGGDRLKAFASCGSWAWVVRHPTDPNRYAVMADKCHDRFCVPCSRERSHLIANRLSERIIRKPHRLITLTIKSDEEPLADLLDKLLGGFAKLRRINPWKRSVIGGVAFTEIHWNEASHRWHPHLHIICEGSYIPKTALMKAWWRVTGDSYIVDVRKIADAEVACRYVAKYAAKGLSRTFINRPDRLDEAIVATTGRRLANTFGSWRSWRLYEVGDPLDWLPIGRLSEFRAEAASGDPRATRVLGLLRREKPWTEPLNKSPPKATCLSGGG